MTIRERIQSIKDKDRIVLLNTFFAFLIKGGSLVISLLTTPAFIRYFDNNAVLGVWYTLLSVLVWFLNFDLGIGNGIRNNLVKDLASNDMQAAKRTVSSGIFSNLVVTAALTVIGLCLIFTVDLNWLYQIDSNIISYQSLRTATVFVFFAIMIRFLLTTVSSVFYAMQKSAVNGFLTLCVAVLQLLFVKIVRFENEEKAIVGLSVAYLFITNLPMLLAGVVIFTTKMRKCAPDIRFIRKDAIKSVMGIGSVFFVCQILYMLIANTNEFLVTNLFGPECTTEYTFYYKMTILISTVVTLAMTPVWSVITKAMAEKDYVWLRGMYKKAKLIGLAAIAVQFLFIPFQQFAMDIWLGENSIPVDYSVSVAFACFGSAFVYSSILSTVVCGMARMKLQAVCYAVGIVLKFSLVYILASVFENWSIVVWANVLVLASYSIIQQIDLDRYIGKLIKTQKDTSVSD